MIQQQKAYDRNCEPIVSYTVCMEELAAATILGSVATEYLPERLESLAST